MSEFPSLLGPMFHCMGDYIWLIHSFPDGYSDGSYLFTLVEEAPVEGDTNIPFLCLMNILPVE